jgi:hypothetical protein
MELAFAFLAEAAQVLASGKMNVLGGGTDVIQGDNFPLPYPAIALVAKFRAPPEECGIQHLFHVDIIRPEGGHLGPGIDIPFVIPVQGPNRVGSFTIKINIRGVVFPTPGNYTLRLSVDGREFGATPLEVNRGVKP